MNFLSAQCFNNFLAELPQTNTSTRNIRIASREPKHISLFRSSVPAEKKIRRAQMEETESMTLNNLPEIYQSSQLVRGWRNFDGKDRIPGLCRSEHMTDRADAANARRDPRQFAHRPALAKLFEAAKLGHMKLRIGHVA